MRPFRLLVRVAVAAGLTAYLLWVSQPREVLAALAGAAWPFIGAAILLVLVDRSLMAYRWLALLCIVPDGERPRLGAVMRIFFVSTFLGTFLPASVGGDAVRAYSMVKLDVRGGDAVASVFLDRMIGVASVLLMAVVGLALARDLAGNGMVVGSLAVAAAGCAFTLLLIFSSRAAAAAGTLIARAPERVRAAGQTVLASIRRYAHHHGQLARVLVWSVAVQLLRIAQAYLLGRGLGIVAPIEAYVAFIPLILLVMLLPITVNGLGTSQAAFVWFFAQAGVAAAPAFALSVLFVALGVVGNLPGGLLCAIGRRPSPDRVPAASR